MPTQACQGLSAEPHLAARLCRLFPPTQLDDIGPAFAQLGVCEFTPAFGATFHIAESLK